MLRCRRARLTRAVRLAVCRAAGGPASLNPINISILATALVPISQGLGVSAGRTAVLVAAVYLATAIGQPTMGKLGSHFGHRRILVVGMVVTIAGGILGGVAQSLEVLFISRVVVGLGTSAGYPNSMALIRRRAEGAGVAAPGSVLGWLTIAGQVTVAVGLPLGGVLVGVFGWRMALLVNVPFALAGLLMTLAWIPADGPRRENDGRRTLAILDVAGIFPFSACITALLLFTRSIEHPAARLGRAGCGDRRGGRAGRMGAAGKDAVLYVRALGENRALSRTYVRNAVTMLGGYCVTYGLTLWLQETKGVSAASAGLIMVPMAAVGVIITRTVSRRNLVRGPLIAGAVASLLMAVMLSGVTTATPLVAIVAATVVLGVMLGLCGIGNQAALYVQSPSAHIATAAGLLRTFMSFAAIASSAVVSLAYSDGVSDDGLHKISLILIATSVIVLALTLAERGLPRVMPQPVGESAVQPVAEPAVLTSSARGGLSS